jgi:ABC-2 type transport system permease protein
VSFPSLPAPERSTPNRPADAVAAGIAVASRTLRELFRSPQLLAITLGQGVLFLLVFRYVFGGAIATGQDNYVDYLAPGVIAAGVVFAATGAGVAVAQDRSSGLAELFATHPVPRLSLVAGRILADTVTVFLAAIVLILAAFAVGFRPEGAAPELAAAAVLVVLYAAAYAGAFGALGSVAGGPQAAQGLGFIAIPFTFVSSAYVPVDSMPSWLAWFAEHQPITIQIDALRALASSAGDPATAVPAALVTIAILAASALTMLIADVPRRRRLTPG